jgi:twitching motility protein PilT
MASIDSILRLAVEQGADELHVGTGVAPRMLGAGVPKKLSIPATPEPTLRHLLGELLPPERARALAAGEGAEATHEVANVGRFRVVFRPRPGGFDVAFALVREPVRVEPPAPPPEPAQEAPSPAAHSVGGATLGDATIGGAAMSSPAARGGGSRAVRSADVLTADSPANPPALARVAARARDAPPTGLVARVAAVAARAGASDVHLAERDRPRLRVAGALVAAPELEGLDVVALASELVGGPLRDAPPSLDLGVNVRGVGRLRAHLYVAAGSVAVALRLLPGTPPSLASLGLPLDLGELVDRPEGLVLVCGPTGSGKSSTLAALARHALSKRPLALVTLEDPIELALGAPQDDGTPLAGLVRQREVGTDVASFAAGLRDALRADPDVILVGELRDPDTIALALTAAETGHLVLASLHARGAASAVERIVDAMPAERQRQARGQLAESLAAVVGQRLLPGSHRARMEGRARVPALEVLRATGSAQNLLREGKTAQLATLLQAGRQEGQLPLERSLAELVREGRADRAVARAAAPDPASFDAYLLR